MLPKERFPDAETPETVRNTHQDYINLTQQNQTSDDDDALPHGMTMLRDGLDGVMKNVLRLYLINQRDRGDE